MSLAPLLPGFVARGKSLDLSMCGSEMWPEDPSEQ